MNAGRPRQAVESAVEQLALTPARQALVRRLIDAVLPGARAAVFGSRATGRARPHADLDLLFIAPPCLSWAQRADLRGAFEFSDLPFSVDLVDAAGLPEGMARRIANESMPLG